MVFGLSALEVKVSTAFLHTRIGYPDVVEWKNVQELYLEACKNLKWVDPKSFRRAFSLYHAGIAFYNVLSDNLSDDGDKTMMKIKKYLRKDFIEHYEISEEQMDETLYYIGLLFSSLDYDDVPGRNYVHANVFWNFYDFFADRLHQSPSKIEKELEFGNNIIGIRKMTMESGFLSEMINTLTVISIQDSIDAVKRLR